MAQSIANMQLIQFNRLSVYIFPMPTNDNSRDHALKLSSSGVKDIVHFTELEYSTSIFSQNNIFFHDLSFADGGVPSPEQLLLWFELLDTFFPKSSSNKCVIGIHCKSSVGRAPLMLSIALIYLYGINDIDAVLFVREKIHGAMNKIQLKFLSDNYKQIKKKGKKTNGTHYFCCV